MAVVRLLLCVTDVLPVIQRVSLVHSLILSIQYPSIPVSASYGVNSTTLHFMIMPLKLHQTRYLASYVDMLERRQIYSPIDIYKYHEFGTMHSFPDLIFLIKSNAP